MFQAVLCVHLLLIVALHFQAEGWRGIRPLHSTREDVERLAGPPLQPKGSTYDVKDERVTVVYADGPCAEGWPYGWNVPPGTVVSVTAYQKTKPSLRDLRIDLSKYDRSDILLPSGTVFYSNEAAGVSIEAGMNDEVRAVTYTPAASDEHLRCPEAAARELEIKRGESAYLKPLVRYHDIPSSEEKTRLEDFAEQLQRHSKNSKVYIIGYAGRRACPNEAQTHLEWVKSHLITEHGVESQRVVTINGGHRDGVWVELYIVPQGGPKPLASPNIHPKDLQIVKDGGVSGARRSARRRCGE